MLSSLLKNFLFLRLSLFSSSTPLLLSLKKFYGQPPIFNWVKCNSDGTSLDNLGPSSCGGFFINSNAEFHGAFTYTLGISNSLSGELNDVVYAHDTWFDSHGRQKLH
jgi:hypothetical protein